jgi:3-methyladenine DNA glycosylase/8-oxoguanine DNA glycosylase
VPDVRELILVDTLKLAVSQPFNFRYTLWKPSRFATGLEAHSLTDSWRTFRLDGLTCGVHARMSGPATLTADVYADAAWQPAHRAALIRRLRWSYGLDEDLTDFLACCAPVPAMAEPLAVLGGMRQSCPENLFEIAIISLLLQNATVARTAQMMGNLLDHYGQVVHFAGRQLRAFFTPEEIADVHEERFRQEDRLGYRAKYIGRSAEFFAEHGAEPEGANRDELSARFQTIKGVGPYTAAILASHASRDRSALGLDVWNRKLLARRLLDVDDAPAGAVMAACTKFFPDHQGLAALYLIEHEYAQAPVVELVDD